MQTVCKLCRQLKVLVNSHSIPDSLFRQIFKAESGQAVALVGDDVTPNALSQDSWSDYLLCEDCERSLNEAYDEWGLRLLRGKIGQLHRSEIGVTFHNLDINRLRKWILSLMWRISISSHKSYSNVNFPREIEDHLRSVILNQLPMRRFDYPMVITRLRTLQPVPGFSESDTRTIQAAPFARQYPAARSVCFVMLGFFVEVFFESFPKAYRKKPQLLTGNNSAVFCLYQSPFEIKEFSETLGKALAKESGGRNGTA